MVARMCLSRVLIRYHLQIGPAQHLFAPQHGHSVMTHAALVGRHIGLQLVFPAPEQLEAPSVPDHRVEGRKKAQPVVDRVPGGDELLALRPEPSPAVDLAWA